MTTNKPPIHRELTPEEREQRNREAITYYFIRAWIQWDQAFDIRGDWLEQGFMFNRANTDLYQAIGLAGLHWPWEYKLPRTR